MTGNYLINTDNWFIAPDGKQYKAVYGNVQIVEDTFLGVKTNARATNWYAMVGSEDNHVIIAGCQIHYATKCNELPELDEVDDYSVESGEVKKYRCPSRIWDATKPYIKTNAKI